MKRLLVTSGDVRELRAMLAGLGGTLSMRLVDDLFLVNVPFSTDPGEVDGLVSGDPVTSQLSGSASEMAEAWQNAERSIAETASGRPDYRPTRDHQAPLCGTAKRKSRVRRGERALADPPTSEYAVGSVAVGLVMVSGPGNLAFSTSELTKIRSQALTGVVFLQKANPLAKLEYQISPQTVVIDVPAPRNCSDENVCEATWRDPVLRKLGYPVGAAGVTQYVADVRARLGTRWAYAVFVTKYPLFNGAGYTSYDMVVINYYNGNRGPDKIFYTFAHETCHIFGARDEYVDSGCSCNIGLGVFRTANCNCGRCPGDKLSCLMDGEGQAFCTWTRRQIGWNAWSPQTNVTDINGAKTADAPAAAWFNGRLHVAYRGDSTSHLWMSTFDGTTWSAQTNVTDINGAKLSLGPALATMGSRLYMAYRGDTTSHLWMSTFDGTTWSAQTNITDINGATSFWSPALATMNGRLYMVWRGRDVTDLWMANFNGTTWSEATRITDSNGARSALGPALAVLGNRMYMVHVGDSSSNLWVSSFNGTLWSEETNITDINGAKSGLTPAAHALGNNLVVAYRGESLTNLYSCVFDGTSWLDETRITDQNGAATKVAPALAAFEDGLQLVYRGFYNYTLWSSHYAPDAPQTDSLQTALWRLCPTRSSSASRQRIAALRTAETLP